MKNLLCLAMSLGFIFIFYLYIRNKLSVIDARLNTLTDIVHTLASEFSVKEKNILTGNEIEIEIESDSDSESESGSESDTDDEKDDLSVEFIKVTEPLYPKIIKQEPIELKESESEPVTIELTLDIPSDLIEVSDDETTVKHVQIELTDYSSFTLKELKQKVLDLGGPSLKTKKLLIDFLEKKV
jgi:hypothetical protein